MQCVGDRLVFSPSDLSNYIACEHLTQLEGEVASGRRKRPRFESAYADLIREKGELHEQGFLESLRAAGHWVVRVGLGEDRDFEAAARATADAMRSGAAYVYQSVFQADGWRGIADFLERVERPSALGSWSYVVLDTKLARHPRPEHALQLCFYSQALARMQGLEPEHAYVVLGTRERVTIRLAAISAYYRRVRGRFESSVTAASATPTSPYPCDHCPLCDFQSVCKDRWEREDHLSRIAEIHRGQFEKLSRNGIATLTALAEAPPDTSIPRMRRPTFEALREQAALQLRSERAGRIEWLELPPESGRGLANLPPRSPGDLFFDLEGHPFFDPAYGLEFLFGVLHVDGEEPRYQAHWAHDREGERRTFEAFIDLVHGRLARYPGFHVYHYGPHEPSTMKRLMGEHVTRDLEIDDLLRNRVFVDLYSVVRQAVRAGTRGYSLKDIEAIFGFTRTADVKSGTEAIVDYERFMHTRDASTLARIASYNEEDCRSTLALLEWLHAIRSDDFAWPEPPTLPVHTPEQTEAFEKRRRLREALVDGAEPGTARWLAGELLEYHQREARPEWWWYFERLGMTPEELEEDTESIGGLELDAGTPPERQNRSTIHTLTFPAQDHKLKPGKVHDPATGKGAGEIVSIDDATRILRLLRGPSLSAVPLPRALIASNPYGDQSQRDAVLRVAESIRDGDRRYPALEAILGREAPRVRGRAAGASIQTTDLDEMKALALGLDGSYLFIQGPPGSGKTYNGARIVVDLIEKGKRVGITAQSHKAIHNLLKEVETVALEAGVRFRGIKKSSGTDESSYAGPCIASHADPAKVAQMVPGAQLVAGTAWLFARKDLDQRFDTLVVDEAGQMSLADAMATGTSARNLILLGDPLQLAQVSQGIHPAGSGVSVLEHLLAEEATIPVDRGVFLEHSYRMHPGVCTFISEVVYAGRLRSHESAARRSTAFGTGIRFLSVEHSGNRSSSEEETSRIARAVEEMIGGSFTEADGSSRPLSENDFMVVTPYNAQVRRLRAALPDPVRVGTVDKFQGQEAPVVFFSMATSSGEDVPRNLAFLFSRNRLNVAISRAQCLAFLVCSPRLLEARCRSIEEMELVNALCCLAEYAETGPQGQV